MEGMEGIVVGCSPTPGILLCVFAPSREPLRESSIVNRKKKKISCNSAKERLGSLRMLNHHPFFPVFPVRIPLLIVRFPAKAQRRKEHRLAGALVHLSCPQLDTLNGFPRDARSLPAIPCIPFIPVDSLPPMQPFKKFEASHGQVRNIVLNPKN